MRKFILSFPGAAPREFVAKTYSVFPKTGWFDLALGDGGATVRATTTSGRGKSKTNNFYLLFVEELFPRGSGKTLFWTRLSAEEFALARDGRTRLYDPLVSVPAGEEAPPAAEPSPGPVEPATARPAGFGGTETAPVGDDPVALAARAARANGKRARRVREAATV